MVWIASISWSANAACRWRARTSRAARVPAVLLECSGHELDAVALRLPPGDATLDLGARLWWARRRDDADRGAWWRSTSDQRVHARTLRLDQQCGASSTAPPSRRRNLWRWP